MMSFFELLIISIALSMDAFAVSITEGLSLKKSPFKAGAFTAFVFSFFHVGMVSIGFGIGIQFAKLINTYDHWIAFFLLSLLGIKMIWEGAKADTSVSSVSQEKSVGRRRTLTLAFATSIDALAVGVSLAFLDVSMPLSLFVIGLVVFTISLVGFGIGVRIGNRFKSIAEVFGGCILLCIGSKILWEHLH
jgi:putative Mn2+ efflux pump MntP